MIRPKSWFSLPFKITLLSLLITLVGIVPVFLGVYDVLHKSLEINSLKFLSDQVKREVFSIEKALQTIQKDAILLSNSSSILNMERSFDKTYRNISYQNSKYQVEEALQALFIQTDFYKELSLVLDTGEEVTRLIRESDKIQKVKQDQLQNKKNSLFFRRASVLSKGDFLVSDIFLHGESGQITKPLSPMLRFVTPVYKFNSGLVALIVIQVELNKLVSFLNSSSKETTFFVTNERGDYILHPDSNKIMSFEFGKKLTVQQEYSLPWSRIHSKISTLKSGEALSTFLSNTSTALNLHFLKFDHSKKDKYLMIGATKNLSNLALIFNGFYVKILLIFLVFLFALCLMIYSFVKKLSTRIIRLAYALDQLQVGADLDINTANKKDEISLLVIAFKKIQKKQNQCIEQLQLENQKLRNSLEEIQSSLSVKSRFLAKMSHEIRTPLNGILGITESVLRSDLNQEQKEDLQIVLSSSHTLMKILNDVLEYSKSESDQIKLHLDVFDLNDLIKQVYRLFYKEVDTSKIEFSYEISYDYQNLLIGDIDRLRQILMNLLNNAIKFTNIGKILLKTEVLDENTQSLSLRFIVEDTGIGICEADQKKLFKEYVQADSTISSKYGGTGLGLAIVQNLVNLMGGQIVVTSKEGQGSTFSFELEFLKAKDINQLEPLESFLKNTNLQEIRILIVEDDVVNQRVIVGLLHQFSLQQIDIANNGKEALDLFQAGKYDLIFLDLHLPGIDGLEIARSIRDLENGQLTPIVILTADVFQDNFDSYSKLCISECMTKPIDSVKLFTILESLLNDSFNKNLELSLLGSNNQKYISIDTLDSGSVDILKVFLRDFPDRLQKLENLMKEKNINELLHSLQNLKGICLNLSLLVMVEYVESLEQKISNEEDIDYLEVIGQFNKQIQTIIDELENIDLKSD